MLRKIIVCIVKYFYITTNYIGTLNIFGFSISVLMASQLMTGVFLAFSYVPETMLIPCSRDFEESETVYVDDLWWLHEHGLDALFVIVDLHILRKIFYNMLEFDSVLAWKSGVVTYFFLHVTVFLGLILSVTHLSEITFTVVVTAIYSFIKHYNKLFWIFFTDRQLNADTLLRVAYAHYLMGFYTLYLVLGHTDDMHYDWKSQTSYDGTTTTMHWWDDSLGHELSKFKDLIIFFIILLEVFCGSCATPTVSYDLFTWGEVGLNPDIRFYGVAPHWYFRPYMSWLVICPFHYGGLLGVVYFFILLYWQPEIHSFAKYNTFEISQLLLIGFIALLYRICDRLYTIFVTRVRIVFLDISDVIILRPAISWSRCLLRKLVLLLRRVFMATYWIICEFCTLFLTPLCKIRIIPSPKFRISRIFQIRSVLLTFFPPRAACFYYPKYDYSSVVYRIILIRSGYWGLWQKFTQFVPLTGLIFSLFDRWLLWVNFHNVELSTLQLICRLRVIQSVCRDMWEAFKFTILEKQPRIMEEFFIKWDLDNEVVSEVWASEELEDVNVEMTTQWIVSYTVFVACAIYTFSFLPYGLFYCRLGGNEGILLAFCYIGAFLGITPIRHCKFLHRYRGFTLN